MKKILFLFIFSVIFVFANNNQKILEELDKKCNKNDSVACHQLGNFYFYSRGENENPQKAKEYCKKTQNINQKLCENGDYMACYNLAMILIDEKIEPNFQKAKEYINKTCEFKDGLGACYCGFGELHRDGKGVKKDIGLANSYFEKSCDLNFFPACKHLGDYYRDKKQNLEIAEKYYKKSCDLGLKSFCK